MGIDVVVLVVNIVTEDLDFGAATVLSDALNKAPAAQCDISKLMNETVVVENNKVTRGIRRQN